ncbi:hypothetical protein T10_12457 [Trichinella papuae]|uniref:Uncharacterized protein n=1 Tax=Trichinella papuae TaxID=268474 RepID=A0A0V1MC06_9BILA|nr:hypothetical protein T10_12457 [Trichinella papuae]
MGFNDEMTPILTFIDFQNVAMKYDELRQEKVKMQLKRSRTEDKRPKRSPILHYFMPMTTV